MCSENDVFFLQFLKLLIFYSNYLVIVFFSFKSKHEAHNTNIKMLS